MTTRKGNNAKKVQKYHNAWTYKPGMHKPGRQRAESVASVSLNGLCGRCREKIEWKKKYDKYKPLTTPRKCAVCGGRKVRQAYYTICQECSDERRVCSKCGTALDVGASPTKEVLRMRLHDPSQREAHNGCLTELGGLEGRSEIETREGGRESGRGKEFQGEEEEEASEEREQETHHQNTKLIT